MQQIAVERNTCRVRTETQPVGLNCPLVSISHRRASQFHYPRGQTPPRKQHDVSPLSDSGRREKYDGRGECDCRYMLQRSLNNQRLTSLRGRFRSSDFRSLNPTERHNPTAQVTLSLHKTHLSGQTLAMGGKSVEIHPACRI
jgi:hypothetical protein